jgi:hypothetical protein
MAVKTKKQKVFQDPNNSEKLIVESLSEPYSSSFLIVRNEKGEICAPWVVEETVQIKKRGTMQYGDVMGLKNHQRWARKNAQEKARELARGLQGQLI